MPKIEIYSALNYPTYSPTCNGTEKEITYDLIHDDEDGVDKLIVTGEKDLNAEIQTYEEGCSIQAIIKRYELGDKSVVNVNVPVYDDFSNAPKNLADAYEMMKKAQEQYADLVKKENEKKVEAAVNPTETAAPEGENNE